MSGRSESMLTSASMAGEEAGRRQMVLQSAVTWDPANGSVDCGVEALEPRESQHDRLEGSVGKEGNYQHESC